MKTLSFSSLPAAIGVVLLSVAAVVLSGCSSEIPPYEKEAVNLGTNSTVGSVEIENLLLVTDEKGQPARLIGVLLNGSESNVEVVLADDDDEVTIALEPGQQYAFQEKLTVFETADEIPGALSDVSATVGDESEMMRIPVRNGSLNWLEPYVP